MNNDGPENHINQTKQTSRLRVWINLNIVIFTSATLAYIAMLLWREYSTNIFILFIWSFAMIPVLYLVDMVLLATYIVRKRPTSTKLIAAGLPLLILLSGIVWFVWTGNVRGWK